MDVTSEENGAPPPTPPTRRPYLKRSKTISVTVDEPSTPSSNYDSGGINGDSSFEKPKSSCQALRRAVSALSRIDDFVLEELGSGFFADVYKATHRVTNEEMVMKINKDIANKHCALREVQLMNKMSHPNILRFLGVCVHEGQLHALTEYLPEGNLEELLARKEEELPWTMRIKLSLDIANGLFYIHGLGYIHRDLSSRNVLIKKEDNKNYQAVVADFGLSTRIPEPNAPKLMPVGSPWWIAPEVIRLKYYDERADLFSFGIINMELTTRINADPDLMPRTNNFGVDYHKICELVDYCPLDFLQLSFKCCQVQPEKRPCVKVLVSTLEKVYSNLISDSLIHIGKGHKRSKSEDNILQCNDSFSDESMFMTAECVAQVMSADDPDYSPALANPFAGISQLRYGHKLVDFHPRRISVSSSPTHYKAANLDPYAAAFMCPFELNIKQESLSLPSSPIMLRKAAEKLHQVSLHGSDAVKTESKPDLVFAPYTHQESQDILGELNVFERQTQFRNNRTRSLGSLDYDYSSGRKVKGVGGNGNVQTNYLHHNFSDPQQSSKCQEILRESSQENVLDGEEGMYVNSEDFLGYTQCNFNQGNCSSLARESLNTATAYRDVGADPDTDTPSDVSLSGESVSSCISLSVSDTSCPTEGPPLISTNNGNYESNHF